MKKVASRQDERSEFEAFMQKECGIFPDTFLLNGNGEYILGPLQNHWLTWQAASRREGGPIAEPEQFWQDFKQQCILDEPHLKNDQDIWVPQILRDYAALVRFGPDALREQLANFEKKLALAQPPTSPKWKCANCGHSADRHEIEPPYPCYDCDCQSCAAAPLKGGEEKC